MPLFLVFLIIYIHGIYTVSGSFYSQSFTKQVASLNDEIDTEAHEVTVVGSMIVDLVSYSSRLPKAGETIRGHSFERNFGGKGANQAVACARLGIKTRMCGLVGNDEYGKDYKTQLMNEKVSVSDVRVSESKSTTAIACINVGTDNGSNTIVIIPGVLNEFKFDDNIRCHIQNSKLLLCQNEILFETTKKALEIARESQIISIFNPAPVSNDCINLCRLADIVCPNESELSLLTNMPTDTDEEIAIAANNLLRMSNAKAILVTLGAKGAYLCSSKFKEFIPTKIVNAVDTVGAGDCFIGTLASYIVRLNDDDLDDVVSVIQKALSCASVSVTRFGAQKSYMFLDELEDNLKPKIMTKTDDIYSKSLFYHSICKRFE